MTNTNNQRWRSVFVPTHEIIAKMGPDIDRILVRAWEGSASDPIIYYATREEWNSDQSSLPAWRRVDGKLTRTFDPPDEAELRVVSQETDQAATEFTIRVFGTAGTVDDLRGLFYDMNIKRTFESIVKDFIKKHVNDGYRVEVEVKS